MLTEKIVGRKGNEEKAAQKMLFAAVKLNEKVYNFFNEIILCSRGINKKPAAASPAPLLCCNNRAKGKRKKKTKENKP